MRVWFVLFGLLWIAAAGGRQSAVVAQPLPIDPAVRIGTLPNGLTWYVRENREPARRAELRLVVKAGSVLEDDDQRGLAHFLEHMAFNGTAQFPKEALIDYLETIGMRFGPDVNAYTSFDETVYMLQLPTDSIALFERGLDVLREWAGEVAFDPEEVRKERGVVLEEWRQGRGASARLRDRHFPVMLKGSRYAERLPIGDPATLQSAEAPTLERFYTDWYRPDLMAVIAIGDFNGVDVARWITDRFGTLTRPEAARDRPEYGVPEHDETLVSIATDPESPFTSSQVLWKLPLPAQGDESAERQRLVERLTDMMLGGRLGELTQRPDPPFIMGSASGGSLVGSAGAYSVSAISREGEALRGLEATLTEAERARRFGFTASEFERAKANLVRSYERSFAERDRTPSAQYAAEYIRHFLTDESIPGIEYEHAFVLRVVPGISLAEVNAVASSRLTDRSRVIQVDGPEKDAVVMPTEADLLAVFDRVTTLPLEPYAEVVSDEPLVPATPEPGVVVSRSVDEPLGAVRLTLSNGVRVVLKPTDFKNDQVLFSAYSPGGHSLVPDSKFVSASMAASVISSSGIGRFGPVELGKKLAGRVVGVSPSISERSEGFNGMASPADLETLFQLVHLYFTASRADTAAFQAYVSRMQGLLLNFGQQPESAFGDTISVTMSQGHPRRKPMGADTFSQLDLADMTEVFRDRFADAGDFTFYLVGAFDLEKAIEASRLWLGSLPDLDRIDTPVDVGVRAPDGVIVKEVKRGLEPKSRVQVIYHGPFDWNPDDRARLNTLVEALRIRLREVLREDLGGTYGVSVGGSGSRDPIPTYSISMSFGADPERLDELVDTLFAEVDRIRTEGLDETYVQKVHEAAVRSHETNLRENGWWMGTLRQVDLYGDDPDRLLNGPAPFIATLDRDDLIAAASRWLNPERYVQVTLEPEN